MKEYDDDLIRKALHISDLPPECLNNKDIVFHFLKKNGYNLVYLSQEYRDNEAFVRVAVENCGYVFSYISKRLKQNKEIMMIAIKAFPFAIVHAPDIFKNDTDIAHEAIRRNGLTYRYFSEEIQKNKQLLKLSIQTTPFAFSYAPDDLKSNKEFVMNCIDISPYIFYYVDCKLKDDEDVVSKVIIKGPSSFEHASSRIRNNKEFLLKVVKSFPYAYQSITNLELKSDKDIIRETLKTSASLFLYIPTKIKEDIPFLAELVQKNLKIYPLLSFGLTNNRDFVFQVFCKNNKIKYLVSNQFQSDLNDLENFEAFIRTSNRHEIFHCHDLYKYIQTFLF